MYVCPGCSTENRENAKFCRKCGIRRQQTNIVEAEDSSSCPSCGRVVRSSDLYSMCCGERLKGKEMPSSKPCVFCQVLLPAAATFCVNCGGYVAIKPDQKLRSAAGLFDDDNPDLMPRYEA